MAEMEGLMEDCDSQVHQTFANIHGKPFYIGSVGDRSLVFAIPEMLELLPNDFNMYVDDTFNVTPFTTRASQLLIVHADIHN